jgi:hypothetical protein
VHDGGVPAGPYDRCLGRRGRIHHSPALLEDRPGLIRAVSPGGLSPPQVPTLEAPPIQVCVHQVDQTTHVAGHGLVVRSLKVLRLDPAHAQRVTRWGVDCGTEDGRPSGATFPILVSNTSFGWETTIERTDAHSCRRRA